MKTQTKNGNQKRKQNAQINLEDETIEPKTENNPVKKTQTKDEDKKWEANTETELVNKNTKTCKPNLQSKVANQAGKPKSKNQRRNPNAETKVAIKMANNNRKQHFQTNGSKRALSRGLKSHKESYKLNAQTRGSPERLKWKAQPERANVMRKHNSETKGPDKTRQQKKVVPNRYSSQWRRGSKSLGEKFKARQFGKRQLFIYFLCMCQSYIYSRISKSTYFMVESFNMHLLMVWIFQRVC